MNRPWTEERMKNVAHAVVICCCEDHEVPYEIKQHTPEEDAEDAADLRMTIDEYNRFKDVVKQEYLYWTGKTEI